MQQSRTGSKGLAPKQCSARKSHYCYIVVKRSIVVHLGAKLGEELLVGRLGSGVGFGDRFGTRSVGRVVVVGPTLALALALASRRSFSFRSRPPAPIAMHTMWLSDSRSYGYV